MKGILSLLRRNTRAGKPTEDHTDSVLFSTAFAGQGVDASMLVPWEARAVEVGAKRLPISRGGKLLQALWAKDKYMATSTRTRWSAWSASLNLQPSLPTAT
jgi:CRP/FNR family cyclic AMP-dependent transcriptional regulator